MVVLKIIGYANICVLTKQYVVLIELGLYRGPLIRKKFFSLFLQRGDTLVAPFIEYLVVGVVLRKDRDIHAPHLERVAYEFKKYRHCCIYIIVLIKELEDVLSYVFPEVLLNESVRDCYLSRAPCLAKCKETAALDIICVQGTLILAAALREVKGTVSLLHQFIVSAAVPGVY